jgi:hypothetical protein
MPKIRIKNSGNISKSGIVSSEYKKFEKNNFINFKDESFNAIDIPSKFSPFNDDITVNYVEDLLAGSLDYYYDTSSQLSSPSELSPIKVIKTPRKINSLKVNVRDEEISDSKKLSSYKDIASNIENEKSHLKLDILLEKDEVEFQFSKNTNDIKTFEVEDQTIESKNTCTAYWDFNLNRWLFLGDIRRNYYLSETEFLKSPIAFNPITSYFDTSSTKNNTGFKTKTTGGNVTSSFGFPYDIKFKPLETSCLKMSNFIEQDFVLEKIKINFDLEFLCDNTINSVFNYLNFFIINNRDVELEKDLLGDKDLSDAGTYFIFNDKDSFTRKSRQANLDSINEINRVFSIYDVDDQTQETNYNILNFIGEETGGESNKSSVREIVGFSKLVFKNQGIDLTSNTDSFDEKTIENDADYFFKKINEISFLGLTTESSITRLPIDLTFEPCVQARYNINTPFSTLEFIPTSLNTGRNHLNWSSSRSNTCMNEIADNEVIGETNASRNITLDVYNKTRESSKYILRKTDKLTFGFSFSPNMHFDVASGNDLIKILSGINITLYGNYKSNNIDYVKTNKSFIQDNIKIDLVKNGTYSDIINESIFHSKSLYFNRVKKTFIINTGGGQSSFDAFINKESGNVGSSINATETKYKKVLEDNENKNNKMFWNTWHFGLFADFIKTSCWQNEKSAKNSEKNVRRVWFENYEFSSLPTENDTTGNTDAFSRIFDPFIES